MRSLLTYIAGRWFYGQGQDHRRPLPDHHATPHSTGCERILTWAWLANTGALVYSSTLLVYPYTMRTVDMAA